MTTCSPNVLQDASSAAAAVRIGGRLVYPEIGFSDEL